MDYCLRFSHAVVVLSLLAVHAAAQGPPFGGGSGGGFRGGFDPAGFLSRLDANENGQIDPDEAEGRAGYFLRRIAENNPQIDLSRPVPIERIQKAFSDAQERRGSGRSDDNDSRRDRSRDDSSSDRSRNSAKSEPVILGFGEDADLPVVPGFGFLSAATKTAKVTEEDISDATRRFRYYDRNKDGVLDTEEMQRSRSGDYERYDRDGNGKLTVQELAVRYAERRIEREAAARNDSSSSTPASNSTSTTSSQRRSDEGRSWGGWTRRDDSSNRDSSRSSRDSDSRSSSKSSAEHKPYRIATSAQRLEKMGAPSWFRDSDKDGDGQVAMAEFADTWSDRVVDEFASFDLNGDGLITPRECFNAAKTGADRSSSSSSLASRTRPSYSRPPSDVKRDDQPTADKPLDENPLESESSDNEPLHDKEDGKPSDAPAEDDATSSESVAAAETAQPADAQRTETIEVSSQYLNYAMSRIKDIDENGDGFLQPQEWSKMRNPPEGADRDGDKKISAYELALFLMKQ